MITKTTTQTLTTFSFLIFTLAAGVLSSGCAYQTRTATSSLSQDQIISNYNAAVGGSSATSTTGTSSGAGLLNQDPSSILYFVTDDSNRPVNSILSMDDMGSIDPNYAGQPIEATPYIHAEVFFVDGFQADQDGNGIRTFELTIVLQDNSGNTTTVQWLSVPGSDQYSNGLFSVQMQSNSGSSIILQSSDVDSSSQSLNSGIQLDIFDGGGNPVGQISTMASFD